MIKLSIMPYRKNGNDPARPMKVIVHDYWDRSVIGFGSYAKEINHRTYKRLSDNANLYYIEGGYRLKVIEYEETYFIVINLM